MNKRQIKLQHRQNCISSGFTLLEILIALFIFSILSLILAGALRNVINAQSGTERNAQLLRDMQFTLLVMSRDIEQAVNRPVIAPSGKEEPALIGTPASLTFTHAGYANPTATIAHSLFERTRYFFERDVLWRSTWPPLDQAPQTVSHARVLLENVRDVRFEYLDQQGRFQNHWPAEGENKAALPRAVRVTITLSQWGAISQLYVIPVQIAKADQSTPES